MTNILTEQSGVWAEVDQASSGSKKIYRFAYDFTIDGGAVGTIVLRQADGPLPDKFVAHIAQFDIVTAFTGVALSTGALSTGQGAGDLIGATLIAGAPWSTTGLKPTTIVIGTSTTAIKMTAARSPTLVIATTAVTQGVLNLFIEGYLSS